MELISNNIFYFLILLKFLFASINCFNSVSFFYSSHTLEHIPEKCCQHIFNEFYRCLKPKGCVRLTMPDYDKAVDAFEQNNINFFYPYDGSIEQRFLKIFASLRVGKIINEKIRHDFEHMTKEEFAEYYTKDVDLPTVKNHGHELHVNWWNFKKAKLFLENAGFKEIYPSKPNKSQFAEMQEKKLFDYTHPTLSMYVEAVK